MPRLTKDDKRFLVAALDWAILSEKELIEAYGYASSEVVRADDCNFEIVTSTQDNIRRIRRLQAILKAQAKQK